MKPNYLSISVISDISLGTLSEGVSDEFITSGAAADDLCSVARKRLQADSIVVEDGAELNDRGSKLIFCWQNISK